MASNAGSARHRATAPTTTARRPVTRRLGVAAIAGVLVALAVPVGPVAPAGAGAVQYQRTQNFTTPGAATFTVPACATQLVVVAIGGGGGSAKNAGNSTTGGDGARVAAALPVAPGQVLDLFVGGGGDGLEFNDGTGAVAGGGGSTTIDPTSVTGRVIAGGGGGGGAGSGSAGGDAGQAGGAGGDGEADAASDYGHGGAGGVGGAGESRSGPQADPGGNGSGGAGGAGRNGLTINAAGGVGFAGGGSGGGTARYSGSGGGGGFGGGGASLFGGAGAGGSTGPAGSVFSPAGNGGIAGADGGNGSISLTWTACTAALSGWAGAGFIAARWDLAGETPPESITVVAAPGDYTCTASGTSSSCALNGLDPDVTYTLTMYGDDPTVLAESRAVTPRVCGALPSGLSDVPVGVYYERAASCLTEIGITTNNPYKPAGLVSRAQMAAFLWRMAGFPPTPSCSFGDVNNIPAYALNGACWLQETGITTADPFRPADPVKRAEMAAFLWRYAGSPRAETCTFTDAGSIPVWATTATCWLRANGITTANPFRPTDRTTRAEMAAFLYRTGGVQRQWISG